MLGTTCSLYDIYPEQNPFELHPPVYQLRPRAPKKWASDTQEFRDAARAIAERTAQNPLALCYGTNPLVVLDPESIDVECTQFPNYKPPPPLPQASLQGRMEFLERIHPSGHTPLFTVRVDGHVRLLKVVRNDYSVYCLMSSRFISSPTAPRLYTATRSQRRHRLIHSSDSPESKRRTRICCITVHVQKAPFLSAMDGWSSRRTTWIASPPFRTYLRNQT